MLGHSKIIWSNIQCLRPGPGPGGGGHTEHRLSPLCETQVEDAVVRFNEKPAVLARSLFSSLNIEPSNTPIFATLPCFV